MCRQTCVFSLDDAEPPQRRPTRQFLTARLSATDKTSLQLVKEEGFGFCGCALYICKIKSQMTVL